MTEHLSRRGLLACLPAATVATIVPAAAEPSPNDPVAVPKRAEHVVSLLRNNSVMDSRFDNGLTWHPAWFDDASADRMIGILRAEAAGAPITDESLEAMCGFCRAHHQSVDYILTGNIDDLIGWAASNAPAAFDNFTA